MKYILFALFLANFANSKVRDDLTDSVLELLEVGPNKWVRLPTSPTGKYWFQRGLAGFAKEPLHLFSGAEWGFIPHVCHPTNPSLLDRTTERASAFYSRPLTVRGRTNRFHEQTSPFRPNIEAECQVAYIAPELNIDFVESIGAFIPHHDFDRTDIQYIQVVVAFVWAREYTDLYKALLDEGFKPTPSSRGFQFYLELTNYFSNLERYRFLNGSCIQAAFQSFYSASKAYFLETESESTVRQWPSYFYKYDCVNSLSEADLKPLHEIYERYR